MKFFISLLLMISFYSFAEDDNHNHDHNHDHTNEESSKKDTKSLDAHVHGVSILNIVQDMKQLSFEFEMPGFDVVGFEYKAKKKEDIKKVRNALGILSDYKNMIDVPASEINDSLTEMAQVIKESGGFNLDAWLNQDFSITLDNYVRISVESQIASFGNSLSSETVKLIRDNANFENLLCS